MRSPPYLPRIGGKDKITVRAGALASGEPHEGSGKQTNKSAVDWLIMGTEEGTRDMTWTQIVDGADKLRVKGGQATQIVARAGALVSGTSSDRSGKFTNKAATDWMIMGAEEGTCDKTWAQIEEGADKLRAEGGKASEIVLRIRALESGASADALGQVFNRDLDVMNFCIMGREMGCMGKTQEQITEGAGKKSKAAGAARCVFCFLFEAATQLARQLHQECTQVVCSNKVDRSRLALRHSRY